MGPASPLHRVLIEFDRNVADEIRSRKIHPSQKIATAADGRVRLSVVVSELDKITRWILGFGMAACVIEPEALAQTIRSQLKLALNRYQK